MEARRLFPQHVFRDEEDVRRALSEAAHEVGVPLAAEGNVNANVVALGNKTALQVAADTEEHLEFEVVSIDAVLCGEALCRGDHLLVVRGEAVVSVALEQQIGQLHVACVDVGFLGECDFRRFLVGAFAQANADAVGDERLDVGLRAIEVRLDDNADVAAQVGAAHECGARCRA